MAHQTARTILFWGRADPDYSRTRVVRDAFEKLGWSQCVFLPRASSLGHLEASLRRVPKPDVVWVMCFRQRDVRAACRWAQRRGIAVVFDALISAYDKQVFERTKFAAESASAQKLLAWERHLLALPDVVVVDTQAHAEYFHEVLRVPRDKLVVVPVGAQAGLFEPAPVSPRASAKQCEVLFYGSFISLQGPETIVEAAKLCHDASWVLLGDGPLRQACQEAATGVENIAFESPLPYRQLPERIHRADILLGIFGDSAKASRVIPNKVYQSLACSRAVITRDSTAYPRELRELEASESGMVFVPPADAQALADAVREMCCEPTPIQELGVAARTSYERWFSPDTVQQAIGHVLDKCVR